MKQVTMLDVSEFDELVKNTYGKPYRFQQQDGCKERGVFHFTVPCEEEDFEAVELPEKVNHSEMGISFATWLARDPEQGLESGRSDKSSINLWWGRNFYPHVTMLINDLHAKGILAAGQYCIDIDW